MRVIEIEILLHYFSRVDDHPKVDEVSYLAWPEAFEKLVSQGLLSAEPPLGAVLKSSNRYYPTEACNIYCRALKAVPLPVQKWVMPEPFQSLTDEDTL